MTRRIASALLTCTVLASGAGAACSDRGGASSTGSAQPATPVIRPVVLPDLGRVPAALATQLRERHAAVDRMRDNTPGLAQAYGELGMALMAAEAHREAEAALANAEALASSDMRWPYYRAHVFRLSGRHAESLAAFERAVRIDGDYLPALVWMGNAHLDAGQTEQAEASFSRALAIDPRNVAAQFGLGRAALARRDFAAAITHLQGALTIDPDATVVHYPLALAYRGAGQIQQAEAHLRPEGTGELKPVDPLLDELELLLETPLAFELRGVRALENQQWPAAIEHFRRSIALAPDNPSVHHKLATALALNGDAQGAVAELQQTTRRFPMFAKAHYSLGLLWADQGRTPQAIDAFSAALRSEPFYVEARLQLAHTLRRAGRAEASLPHYTRALELDAGLADARFGQAMALVVSRRYAEARDLLMEGRTRHADQPAFAIALARVLAAAPDPNVRDGQRALALLEGMPMDQRTLGWGMAMAMTLAELGRFDDAIVWQRQAVASTTRADDGRLQEAMTERLRAYEQHQPSRRPWLDAEPMDLALSD